MVQSAQVLLLAMVDSTCYINQFVVLGTSHDHITGFSDFWDSSAVLQVMSEHNFRYLVANLVLSLEFLMTMGMSPGCIYIPLGDGKKNLELMNYTFSAADVWWWCLYRGRIVFRCLLSTVLFSLKHLCS